MNKLPQLNCSSCGGCIPLIAADTTPCVYCGEIFQFPGEYVEAAKAREATNSARKKAEPKWEKLSKGVSTSFVVLGGALIVVLPPLATHYGHVLPEKPLASAQIIAFYAIPAIIPGSLLFTFSAAMQSIGRPFKAALSAIGSDDPTAPPLCRSCNAALDTRGNKLSVTCAYCGTDSLLESLSVEKEQNALGKSLQSLDLAIIALKRRRVWLGLGLTGAFSLLAGLSFFVAAAFFGTV